MTHEEKISWMAIWAAKNQFMLQLAGECGFGRDCVGVSNGHTYPDYNWYTEDYDRADNNGDVWTPDNAYHKHTCVAVLGRGEQAESQLYEWLKWFDDNGFVVEHGDKEILPGFAGQMEMLMSGGRYCRMVRKVDQPAQVTK